MQTDNSARSFIAIELPSEIRDGLKKIQDDLKDGANKVAWVSPENIHLTIKFLGNIEPRLIDEISGILERAADQTHGFRLSVKGVGAFPSLNNPRVVWVGVEEGGSHLVKLYNMIEEGVAILGFDRENRDFTPHLTIGRVRFIKDRKAFQQGFEKLKDIMLGEFAVNTMVLFQSVLKPSGAVYSKLKEVKLI